MRSWHRNFSLPGLYSKTGINDKSQVIFFHRGALWLCPFHVHRCNFHYGGHLWKWKKVHLLEPSHKRNGLPGMNGILFCKSPAWVLRESNTINVSVTFEVEEKIQVTGFMVFECLLISVSNNWYIYFCLFLLQVNTKHNTNLSAKSLLVSA